MIDLIHELDLNIMIILLLGLSVGILSGFTGVGGGFVVTPALIILGLPVNIAVGSSLCWVFLNSIFGIIAHRNRGNLEIKLGLFLAIPSILGAEIGFRLSNLALNLGLQEEVTLIVSIILMLFIGAFTFVESVRKKRLLDQQIQRQPDLPNQFPLNNERYRGFKFGPMVNFKHSGVTLPVWIILVFGSIMGGIIGFLGIGGGFIVVPVLIYLLRVPSEKAVGSSTVLILLSSLFGSIRNVSSGSVSIPIVLLLFVMSIMGVYFGVSVTKYIKGVAIRMVLGLATINVCLASLFRLIGVLFSKDHLLFESIPILILFAGVAFLMVFIFLIKLYGKRFSEGHRIPRRFESFCKANR